MGRTKKMYIEIQQAKHIIDSLSDYLITNIGDSIKIEQIEILKNLSKNIENDFIRDLIFEDLLPLEEELTHKGVNNLNSSFNTRLLESIFILKYKIEVPEHFHRETKSSINSETYYNNKITELQRRELELNEILKSNNNQTKEQKKSSEQIAEKLKKIELELNQKKRELEIKQKQEDAKSDWEQKINNTFLQLKEYLNPIKHEHSRLNVLYYTFGALSIVTIIMISLIEFNAINKLASSTTFPSFQQYIMLFLPLPIAGALMWGFVFQMNRAQRQLILIANNIHNINYIQGLLISINNLSPDINDGILRINNALDKIISNHLKNKYISTESELIKEENKDKGGNFDIDKLEKLIKTIKETGK
jgi:hypothetical protein